MLNTVIYGNVTVFNLITAVFFVVVFVFVSKGVSNYLRRILKDKMRVEHLEVILRVVYYGILVTAALIILPILGIKLSGLLVAGGIVGLAVGFASQSIVGNLISGLFLMIERPIKIGNAVNIDGTVGIVQEIRIISTTLRTFDGLYIRVPNQKVFTANITNYSAHQVRRFDYLIGIRYSDDADKALEIIKGMIDDHPLMRTRPLRSSKV